MNDPADCKGDLERYRRLIDAITDYAIYMLDIDGYVSSWNPGARRFKGYAPNEILGEHFSRFYTPEDRAAGVPERALRTAATEGRFDTEGWRVRKDGSRFWAHVIIDPIRDDAGHVVGFAKITRDLTERMQARAALERSENLFRLLVQGVTDYAIFMLDPDGLVSSWNAGAERIKGYSEGEIVGRHFSTFYTEADRLAGLPQQGLATSRTTGRFETEGLRVRKDGSSFIAHVIIDALRDPSGQLLGYAKVTRDVTERVRGQQALEQAQHALFQTQKLESIGQLTGGIAHDFNNLLTAVIGSLELLKKQLPNNNERAHSLLENALHGAERGAALTQRMLSFARRQELNMKAVGIAPLVAGMLDLLDRSLGPTIKLVTEVPESLPPVHTDANQLETALLNLALNARDAMDAGGTIRISACAMSEVGDLPKGSYIAISVADDGLGMDEATLARATEPFFTTKGVGKGTGLGLSMVHGLAEQSDGRLRIDSKPGRGTVVTMIIPVARSNVPPAISTPIESVAPPTGDMSQTVLLVDDDELVLASAAAIIEDLGYRVIAAESAEEALRIVEGAADIDVLMTDQAMPGMTGLQLAQRVLEKRPHLPVIVASGFAEMETNLVQRWRRLPKPFRRAELADALAAAVQGSHAT
ncbi:MAG TPA: PAS domain S-box protein [Rudaea sp.]|jgi:PAS domain S-box-containing protein|nr:PAS domain S-box protein [Rudaea sp.]